MLTFWTRLLWLLEKSLYSNYLLFHPISVICVWNIERIKWERPVSERLLCEVMRSSDWETPKLSSRTIDTIRVPFYFFPVRWYEVRVWVVRLAVWNLSRHIKYTTLFGCMFWLCMQHMKVISDWHSEMWRKTQCWPALSMTSLKKLAIISIDSKLCNSIS